MKRKPMLRRKGAPAIVIALGGPPKGMEPERDEEMEDEPLVCPKCGAELADTEDNRDYVAKRSAEADNEDEDED